MRKTNIKPRCKPGKIKNRIQIHPIRISSETQARLRKAINKAEKYGLIPNSTYAEKLKIIVDAFSFYNPKEKYRLLEHRSTYDNLALTAKKFGSALETINDPKIKSQLELPENYRLYDTHKLLLKMTKAYGYAAEKESNRLMNQEKQINRDLRRNTVEEFFILRLAGYYEDVTGNIATADVPGRMDDADPIKFVSFVQMMFKTLGVHKSENIISNQIKASLKKLKSYHNLN